MRLSKNPSGEVKAAGDALIEASAVFVSNVQTHLKNADALLAAAGQVLSAYHVADEVAGARLARTAEGLPSQDAQATESTSAHDGESLSVQFVGPLAPVNMPDPIDYPAYCANWAAYDVPRIWAALQDEGSDSAWAQVDAYRRLAGALEAQFRRMIVLCEQVQSVWQGPAATEFLTRWDQYATDVGRDAMCADATHRALDGVVSTLSRARAQIEPLYARWQEVTRDAPGMRSQPFPPAKRKLIKIVIERRQQLSCGLHQSLWRVCTASASSSWTTRRYPSSGNGPPV